MNIPLLDLDYQHKPIAQELKDAIDEVIQSNHYILGPKVQELEEKIADYVGAKYAVGVSSGSDALLISLMALDIGPGDLVLTTDYSFFATAGAISRLGATPVFIDIELKTYNIDPDQLRLWVEQNPEKISKVKAIIPVHLYGQSADMHPIMEIAQQYNIPVIEDAAQAIGATYPTGNKTLKVGSMGSLACFSFFPSKNLGCFGDGGIVTTSDQMLYEKLLILRNHGSKPKYYHKIIGGNFRLDAIQAAVLLVKLTQLEEWHRQRRGNAQYYDHNIENKNLIKPEPAWGLNNHIYNQYVIRTDPGLNRDALQDFLKEEGVASEIYYPVPFHKQECFNYLQYAPNDFPNSNLAADNTLALPVYPGLSKEKLDYIIDTINSFGM